MNLLKSLRRHLSARRERKSDPYEKERKVIQKKVLEYESKKQPKTQSSFYPPNYKK